MDDNLGPQGHTPKRRLLEKHAPEKPRASIINALLEMFIYI
jgi:hypothetical protein